MSNAMLQEIIDVSKHPHLGDPICWMEATKDDPSDEEIIRQVKSIVSQQTTHYCGWPVTEFQVVMDGDTTEDATYILYSAKRQRWEHPDVIEAYDGGRFGGKDAAEP